MKKTVLGIVVVIVVILIAVSLSNNGSSGKQVIKIGVVAPVTGGAAAYGSTLVKGIEMAAADLKLNNPTTKYSYQVIVEDDETTPAKSASAASKLINIDKVSAIITTTSGSGNAVKPLAEKAKIVHVCVCTDASVGNAPYNFTNLVLPSDEVKAWLQNAQGKGVKTIALLEQVHPGIAILVKEFKAQAANYGITIVYEESFDASNRDFKTIVAKAKKSKPDLYYIGAFPPSLDVLSKELIDAGVKNFSTTGLFSTSPNPSMYNGLWFTDVTLADPAFADRFTQLYPSIRFNARTAPYGYDSYNMIVQAYEKGGDVYQNLKSVTSYQGKSGTISKSADSNNFNTVASIWIMKDGKATMLGQ